MKAHTLVSILDLVQMCEHGGVCGRCCWKWLGGLDGKGYPKVHCLGKFWQVAKLLYIMHGRAKLTESFYACHTCDKAWCVNWNHVYKGTAATNMNDKAVRGRAPKGVQQSQARLTEAQVRQMRRLYHSGGWTIADLRKFFLVGNSVAWRILKYKDWNHLKGEYRT